MNFLRQIFDIILAPIRAIVSSPLELLSASKRMLRMSLPTRVALFVEIVLLLAAAASYGFFRLSEDSAGDEVWLSTQRVVAIVILLIVIPLVVHRALTLWLAGESARFPDIDSAWKEGLAALARQGMSLEDAPIFLVTGARDEKQAAALLDASQVSLAVRNAPAGSAALHWYAANEGDHRGIFLVCTQVGRLSRLSALAASGVTRPDAGAAPGDGRQQSVYGTMVAGGDDYSSGTAGPDGDHAGGDSGEPAAPRRANVFATVVAMAKSFVLPSAGKRERTSGAVTLTDAEATEETARLEYLCLLLRRALQPDPPIRGILTILPFNLVQRDRTHLNASAREDLRAIRRVLNLRCPAVALVGGMDTEAGFLELASRVEEHARAQRFGKGFNLWSAPTRDQVGAIAKHACGQFEEFSYMLFREKDGLTKPGNARLFALLCRIRSQICERIESALVDAYGADPNPQSDPLESLLFSGCYFAAFGEGTPRQAFVAGVFDKLLKEGKDDGQKEKTNLAWTEEARAEDRRYLQLAGTALVVSSLLLVSLIGMLSYHFYFRGGS